MYVDPVKKKIWSKCGVLIVIRLDFDAMLNTGLPLSIYTTKPPIDMWRCNLKTNDRK
jgi:hypothetical protein